VGLVPPAEPDMLGVADRLLEELADVWIVEGVDDPSPVPLPDHETELAQEAKLMGDGRLLHADRHGQLADRARAVAKVVEDEETTRGGEGLHHVRDLGRERPVQDGAASAISGVAHRRKLA